MDRAGGDARTRGDGILAAGRGSAPGRNVVRLVVAVDGAEATTVAWVRNLDVGVTVLEAARRMAGSSHFAPPETLADGAGAMNIAGDQQGRVTLAWTGFETAPDGSPVSSVETATWEPDLAGWTVPEALAAGNLEPPELAVDGSGVVTVAWIDDSGVASHIETRTRPAGSSSFAPVQTLSPASSPSAVDVASNATGRTVLLWSLRGIADPMLQVAIRRAGESSFGVPVDVSTTAGNLRPPVVAIDDAGTVTVAWSEVSDVARVWVATAPAGCAFGPRVQVDSGVGRTVVLSLSSSAAGAAVLAWIYRWDNDSDSRVARAAYRPAGGSFGAPIDLTEPVVGVFDDEIAASVDGGGHAFVAWTRRTEAGGYLYRAYARILDGAAPVLDGVSVPATGTAGASVAVSASATDVWSGPPAISWDFGDGGSGAGGSTSHVYAAAGTYVVRVTATDGAGNASSRTRTIVVGPAAGTDGSAPVLTAARLKPGLLPTGHGARLTVASSERAALSGVVQRKRDGRWRAVGTKRWSVQAGANTKTFYGKTSEQRLRSGTYRVRLVATDPAGNASVTTSIRFRVDRG